MTFYMNILLTVSGFVTALYLKSIFLVGAFFVGIGICLPSFLYLKELNKANIKKDWS